MRVDEIEFVSLAQLESELEHVRIHRLDPAHERVYVLGKLRLADAVHDDPVPLLLNRQASAAPGQHVHLDPVADQVLRELAHVAAEPALDHRWVFPGDQ